MTAAALRLILAGRRLRKEIVTTDCGAMFDRPEQGEAEVIDYDAAYAAWEREEQSLVRELSGRTELSGR